jgi:CRP-like cAMP-binding protein
MHHLNRHTSLLVAIQSRCTLQEAAIGWIDKNMVMFQFKKNETILQAGKMCNYLYFVNEGMLGGHHFNEQKGSICNWISTEGELGTSYYSFISRNPSNEAIESLEASVVTAISYQKLNELYCLFPETERAGRLILEEYYVRLEERLMALQFRSARERYELLATTRPEIIRRAPLGKIATYLGMKQETLSRLRAAR